MISIILILCIGGLSLGLCAFVTYLEKTNAADPTKYIDNDWRNGLKPEWKNLEGKK